MSDRRRDAATATVGLGGVAGAGALRHVGLERAYEGKARPKVPLLHELKLVRTRRGRIPYAAGAALGLVSVPTAAVGTSRLLSRRVDKADDRKRSFLSEGVAGAREAVTSRNDAIKERPPGKLVAGNYLAGAAVGSAAGALVHRAPALRRLPGAMRSGLAAASGVTAGSATLPIQSKITQRATHGEYEVTPTGVRRKRKKRAAPSRTIVDGRPGKSNMHPMALRQAMVPSSDPFEKRGERTAARWTVGLTQTADKMERRVKRGRLVPVAAIGVRSLARDASPLARVRIPVHKAGYYGEDMSRREKRARVAAVGGAPFVGDFAQAAQAGRMAPPGQRGSAAALQYSGGQVGGAVGQVAGAAGALGLASRSHHVQRGAEKVTDAVDRAESTARRVVRAPAKGARKPGMLAREAANPKAPRAVRAALRPVVRNPKAAIAGALIGGAIGSQAGGQAGYGIALNREDAYKRRVNKNMAGKMGGIQGGRFAKAADTHPLSNREQRVLRQRKNRSAVMSAVGGATGIASLAALGASRHPKLRRLKDIQTPLLTTGAGVGGINAFTNAAIQRKEAQASAVRKALVPTGIRRAPAMRAGFIRQTRYRDGRIKVSSVRGGLA